MMLNILFIFNNVSLDTLFNLLQFSCPICKRELIDLIAHFLLIMAKKKSKYKHKYTSVQSLL